MSPQGNIGTMRARSDTIPPYPGPATFRTVNAIPEAHRQLTHSLRLEWGPTGADAIGPGCGVAVVDDVLSFTTTLTVAADRGTLVHPYPSRDGSAGRFAADRDAVLAVGRAQARPGQVSLSPATVRAAVTLRRLVLPSPNGSTISFRLAGTAAAVIGVSLRNRRAAARWLLRRRRAEPGLRVAIIAAGERWPDGSLRPGVEDLWGAGGLVAALSEQGWTDASPEALAATAAYSAVADDIGAALHACASGRELVDIGYADDVDTAAQLDRSRSVPVLDGDVFVPQ
jgi:2-phosphosulfolactate phosphatase